ncbi:hypothetical protein ACFSC4_30855 [Deinococcus malanensis]
MYQSVDESLTAQAQIATAIKNARELWWRGTKLADLNQYWPGSYLPEYLSGIVNHVRHVLILNTGRTLTAADLGGGLGGDVFAAGALPYPYEGTSAVVLLLDFLVIPPKRAIASGHVANLGDVDFRVVLIEGNTRRDPITVQPRTSLDLTFSVTGVEMQPINGEQYAYQVVVQ